MQPLLLIYYAFNLSQQWTTDTQTACHKESNNSSVGLHSGFRTRFLSNRFGNCSAIISGIFPKFEEVYSAATVRYWKCPWGSCIEPIS